MYLRLSARSIIADGSGKVNTFFLVFPSLEKRVFSRPAAAAQIEYRQQARPAVRADDDAETGDRDLADRRIRFSDLVADIFCVLSAIGL